MKESRFFKVRIEDEHGNIISETKSDYVMAAVSDPEGEGIKGIVLGNCNTSTMIKGLITINKLKKQAIELNPALKPFADAADLKEKKSEGASFESFLESLFKGQGGGIVVHRELKRILAKAKLGLALTAAEKRICATAFEIIETIAGEIDKEDKPNKTRA